MDEAERRQRRIRRLNEELLDTGVSLPSEPVLLGELDYARHPALHEGIAPRFGALVATEPEFPLDRLPPTALVQLMSTDLAVGRKLADGRTTFVARDQDGGAHLVCLDRVIELESDAIDVATDVGVYVVQRGPTGWVRVCSQSSVVTWDNTRWAVKPRAERVAGAIRRAAPDADQKVEIGLLRLCLHWLSANRVGALLVWSPTSDPRMLEGISLSSAVRLPKLDVTCRENLPALVNVLAQSDRAALVDPHGIVDTLGVALRSTRAAVADIEPFGGTRHTSAQRFSFDQPECIVFVVSAAGPMTVFHRGRAIVATGPGAVAALG